MPRLLILGATSDMAVAIARTFAENGWDLQLAARRPAELQPLQRDLQIRHGVEVSLHPFDALQFDGHAAFVAGLPLLPEAAVYVAGYMADNEAAAASEAETLRTLHTNYTGAVTVLNALAAAFRPRRSGTLIGISSVAGERGRGSNYIYGSAKAGFTAYLSGMRNRLYREGIHVITVLPGFVDTRMTEHLQLPRPLTARPEEVGRAVFAALRKKKNVIYVRSFWRWIMLVIRLLPEPLFKKRNL